MLKTIQKHSCYLATPIPPVNEVCSKFKEILTRALDKNILSKTISKRFSHHKWFNRNCKQAVRRKITANTRFTNRQNLIVIGINIKLLETQLLKIVSNPVSSLNNRGQVDAILLDFSKAFDRVCHRKCK